MPPMTHTGDAVETRIDDSHSYVHHDRPSSEDMQRQRAGEREAARLAVETAIVAPMARLRAGVETALKAGLVAVPSKTEVRYLTDEPARERPLMPGELAAALPGILREALDRMDRASVGLDQLARDVVSAAEAAERSHPPVSAGNVDAVRAILADAVRRADASARSLRGRVAQRRDKLQREGIRALERAAGVVELKRRELQDARVALAADAQRIALEVSR